MGDGRRRPRGRPGHEGTAREAEEAPSPTKAGRGRHRRTWRRRRDWGGILARLVCALFAFVGILPLAVGGLVRVDAVQQWAAQKTGALLARELELDASYDIVLVPWPLELSMENVTVNASDGGAPVLEARRVVARPRIFSLVAGKVDLGDLEVEDARVRLVVRDGSVQNLHIKLPESDGSSSSEAVDIPLASVALTNGEVDLTLDDLRVRSQAIDVDVAVRRSSVGERALLPRHAFEVALRTGPTSIDRMHPSAGTPEIDDVDEDAICRLELRAAVDDGITVRRLVLEGAADLDPDPGTRPGCDVGPEDWRRVEAMVQGLHVLLGEDGLPQSVDGRARVRVPVPIVHRFLDIAPTTGWVEIDVEEAHWTPGDRMPSIRGALRGAGLGIDSKMIAHSVAAGITIAGDVVKAEAVEVGWAGGLAQVGVATISPFEEGIPLDARDIVIDGVELPDLLDDLTAHPHAHVGWNIEHATVDTFGGTLVPMALSGPMVAETNSFAIYDAPVESEVKNRMMGVEQGVCAGTFKVTPEAIVLSGFNVTTPRSKLQTTVSIGFAGDLGIRVFEGSRVDFADMSPVVGIPIAGKAELAVEGYGPAEQLPLEGKVAIDDFRFAEFPIGDVVESKIRFQPLVLELMGARLAHGESELDVPHLSLDFADGDANVVLHADVDTRRQGMWLHDFFEMVKLVPEKGQAGHVTCNRLRQGQDVTAGALVTDSGVITPTWCEMDGKARGTMEVDFVLGGRRDRCGSGHLRVRASTQAEALQLIGFGFESGAFDADLDWDDLEAGGQSMRLDIHAGVLKKGEGTLVLSGGITPGAKLQADVLATSIPLAEIEPFAKAFGAKAENDTEIQRIIPEARASFVAQLGGTLDRIAGEADVDITPLRIGPDVLPASRFRLVIDPTDEPPRVVDRTQCYPITAPFDPRRWAADPSSGVYRLDGMLFGGQVALEGIELTQQRRSILSGRVRLDHLDLGAVANLAPDVAFSRSPPRGWLSASIDVDELPLDDPGLAEVRVGLEGAEIARSGDRITIPRVEQPLLLSGDVLRVPPLPLHLRLRSGLRGELTGEGSIANLSSRPTVDFSIQLSPIDLATLGVDIPQVQRAAGTLDGRIGLKGPLDDPTLNGNIVLQNGMVRVRDVPVGLDDVDVDLDVRDGEIRILRASASVGNAGRLSLSGRIPLDGLDVAGADAVLVASDVRLPVAEGVQITADARLRIGYEPSGRADERTLPAVTGRVTLKRFAYTRPVSFRIDLDAITGGGRTEVDTYKPEDATFAFDVAVVAPEKVRISNNLLDMRLDLGREGLRLSGNDQKFGAVGTLEVDRDSKIYLQGHDFTVDDGRIVFDDLSRIAPRLDVRATTEYRRYATSGSGAASTTSTSTSGGGSAAGGRWRIVMHAFGDTDAPEVRFTSDPPLSQEDIVLLLQVGMTRAELDRGLAGTLAQTVGLEALSAVIGLDQAVRNTVPLIDEFRVGSQYSSRTGRPEPTITLGKRITDDVRATVTTGLGEEREIRSNIEWRLNRGISVQGGYDNVNDVSNSVLGNVGAGLRWRIDLQ